VARYDAGNIRLAGRFNFLRFIKYEFDLDTFIF